MKIIITPAAENFMRRMVRFGNCGQSAGFRLTVTAGGCAGLGTEFKIELAPRDGDLTLDVRGLKVFLPLESSALLERATIDFRDSGMASGLAIVNQNVSDCSCGNNGAGRGGRHATVDISAILRKH